MFCQSLALINKHYKQWNRTKILREVSHYGKTRMNVAMFVLHRGHLDPMSVTRWAQRSQKRVWPQHTETHSHTACQHALPCVTSTRVTVQPDAAMEIARQAYNMQWSCNMTHHAARRCAAWCIMLCQKHRRNKTSFDFCIMWRTSSALTCGMWMCPIFYMCLIRMASHIKSMGYNAKPSHGENCYKLILRYAVVSSCML